MKKITAALPKVSFAILFALFFLGVSFLHPWQTLSAQEATTATQATDSADEDTTLNLKKRIERVVQEQRSTIEDTLNMATRSRKALVGEITRLSEDAITLSNPKGTTILAVTPELRLLKSNRNTNIEALAVGDSVLVLGWQYDQTFEPVELQANTTSLRPSDYTVTLGSIASITSSTLTITPRNTVANAENAATTEYALTRSTKYEDLDGKAITIQDVEAPIQALVVGKMSDNNTLTADIVKILTTSSTTNAKAN